MLNTEYVHAAGPGTDAHALASTSEANARMIASALTFYVATQDDLDYQAVVRGEARRWKRIADEIRAA